MTIRYTKQLQSYVKEKSVHTKYLISCLTFILTLQISTRALQDLHTRIKEEEKDENWKAANCRLCPHCGRAVNKVEGCDSMLCGTDYHGGSILLLLEKIIGFD